MKGLKLIMWKEIKSILRDPKIIIAMIVAPLVMTAVIYGFMGIATRQSVEEALRASGSVAVIDLDHGRWARNFTGFLRDIGLKVYITRTSSPLDAYRETGCRIIYVIPRGFTENITRNKTAHISYYVVLKTLTLPELSIVGSAERYIEAYAENISTALVIERGIDIDFAKHPVTEKGSVILRSRIIEADPETLIGLVMGASIMVPIIMVVLLSMITQFASTSIAVEKEEKMLETLLTLPVKRTTIIIAKIIVAAIVSVIVSIVYSAIFAVFFISMTNPSFGTEGQQGFTIPITVPPGAAASLVATLIANMVFVLTIGVTLSLFAEDVRTAQMINSYVIGPLFILAFIPMFYTPPGSLLPLSLLPVANTVIIPKAAVLGEMPPLIAAPISTTVYAVAASYVAARIISSEKIFTGRLAMKLRRLRTRRSK